MQDEVRLEELPEALPLYRVAPVWRLIAICTALLAISLLFLVLMLALVLVNLQNRSPAFVTTPRPVIPAPPAMPGAAMGSVTGVPDDPTADTPNLPYPVKADLADADPYAPAEPKDAPPAKQPPSARERFLEKGTDLWKLKGNLPDQVVVSPDGEQLAYVVDGRLIAGPIGGQRQIVGTTLQPVPIPAMPGRPRAGFPTPMMAVAES